jgi:hypothetical protein
MPQVAIGTLLLILGCKQRFATGSFWPFSALRDMQQPAKSRRAGAIVRPHTDSVSEKFDSNAGRHFACTVL